MSWEETHRRWTALREVAALAELTDGELPWTAEYAAIFGDRDALVAALRYRWRLTADAQLDPDLPEEQFEERRHQLGVRNAGILRILRQYDAAAARTDRGLDRVVA